MKKTVKVIGIGFVIFIIGGLGGLLFDYVIFSKVLTNPVWAQNAIVKALDNRVKIIKTVEKVIVADNESIADIASRVATTVVYVESIDADHVTASGSGIVVSSDGVIATTTAIVPVGSAVQYVKLADNSVRNVVEVYTDKYSGIVFLRIDESNLATIPFANSDDAQSGKRLISIARVNTADDAHFTLGGLLGNDYTLSIGSPISDFLQGVLSIDFSRIALDKNIGSPVVDFHGNMVGIISYKLSNDIGDKDFYVIASNDVYKAFENFLRVNDEMNTTHSLLGVNYHMITALDVHVQDMSVTSGAVINVPQTYVEQRAFANTLAARSGLHGGDIVVMVNNETVDLKNNLSRLMYKYINSDVITLKILRGDELLTLKIES